MHIEKLKIPVFFVTHYIIKMFLKFLILHILVFKLSSDCILMNLCSLDSSHLDKSNDNKIAFLVLILTKLLLKMYFTICYI